MRLICIRHDGDPDDDRVIKWCGLRGHNPVVQRPFSGESLGVLGDDVIGVVVFGGNYNAYDVGRHPFLADEYRLIDAAMKSGVPLMGICQGAQMIAHHMGAFAGAPGHGKMEFGMYPLKDCKADFAPEGIRVFQWHYHTFDIPAGAVRLAGSELFANQAFAAGSKVLGLQFHAEQTASGFRRWQDKASSDIWKTPGVQSRAAQDRHVAEADAAQARWFYGMLDRFFGGEQS